MVYAIQASLAFGTVTRRDNVLSGITTRIIGRPRWSADALRPQAVPRVGPNGLYAELRFTTKADQSDLEARLDILFPANPPLPGSWLRLHDCPHDTDRGACAPGVLRTW